MKIRVLLTVLVVTVLSLCAMAAAAAAATYNVNVTTDTDASGMGACATGGSPCSLREAINAANAGSGGDTIIVPTGTYPINPAAGFGALRVNTSVTIQGAGANSTTLDGGHATQIMYIGAGTVSISGLTFQHGMTADTTRGAALNSSGGTTVALTSDAFTGNVVQGGAGGAVEDHGSETIDNSAFSGNSATFYGGAIDTEFATSLTIDQSTFTGNQAGGGGGGAIYAGGPAVTVTRSVFSNNSSVVNGGGAIEDQTSGGVGLQVSDSTFEGNSASGSGGAVEDGQGQLTNDTLVGNSPDNLSGGQKLLNTIVAAASGGPNCEGPVASLGRNLEDANTCGLSTANGDQINTDPQLGPLQDNGGPTRTMALRAGSPAIDAGSNSGCPATDQRGVARPQEAACDIGAYELAPPSASTGAASGLSSRSATISAAVTNPDAQAATVTFRYGTSSDYGSTVVESAPALSGASTDTAALSSLTPNTTYHYTVAVTNPDGTSTGVDRTFTTLPPNRFSIKGHKISKSGKLTIKLVAPFAGVFEGKATFKVKHGRHKQKFTYGSARKSAGGPGTVTLTIKLSRNARTELLKLAHATVTVVIKFAPTGDPPSQETIKLKVKVNGKGPFR